MLSAAALREALARYQAESRYPPDSHLHDEATAGQRPAWNQPFATEVALDDRPAARPWCGSSPIATTSSSARR
ncbi:MAG: hypothetical protein HS111_04870 [Kofleriaceae bacterium]|nr:hypothetical protein [Kofleriaceae bacterium]